MAKPLLTPEMQTEIVNLLTVGVTIEDTCASVGISVQTFNNWRNRGDRARKGDEMYVEFFEAITRARVASRKAAVAVIRRSIQNNNSEDAKWYLERSDPERWGKRTYIEGGLSMAFVNKIVRDLIKAGIDPSEAFEALVAEAVYAQSITASSEADD